MKVRLKRDYIIRKLTLYLSILITLIGAGSCLAELTEDQAFQLEVRLRSQEQLVFNWQIAPNHYLYKKQIALTNQENDSLLETNTLPAGTIIKDKVLGEYAVYSNNLEFTIPWQFSAQTQKLLLKYQGCAKDGFCYLPITKLITISGNNINITDSTLQELASNYSAGSLATMLTDRSLPFTLLIFLGLGILLSFTPCVLPMIPIVVNLVVGPKSVSSRKAFLLASSYVLGMAGCYTVAGIVAGLLGATLQAWLQQPLVIVGLSTLLILLALAQFEMIQFSLPHFNTRLHNWSQKQLQGSYIGAFILGGLSALIVSPCITAPLIGALTYIGQHGNPLIGGLALLSLGLGMGIPLIVVAMLSSMILPKAGMWMNTVKNITGLALLGLAIWLLQRVIPIYLATILWGALCIGAGVLFKAFTSLSHNRKPAMVLKFCGIFLALFGGALIFNPIYLQFVGREQQAQSHVRWQDINTVADLNASLAVAKKNNQATILEFYAYWCTSCKRIEATVFTDPEVVKRVASFNLLRVDLTEMDAKQKELLTYLNVYGPPAFLFFDATGNEIKNKRVVGELNTKEMLQILNSIAR